MGLQLPPRFQVDLWRRASLKDNNGGKRALAYRPAQQTSVEGLESGGDLAAQLYKAFNISGTL